MITSTFGDAVARSHLMGALGVAVIAKKSAQDKPFDFSVADASVENRGFECPRCPNRCEIIRFYKNNVLIDAWGNRCPNGTAEAVTPAT